MIPEGAAMLETLAQSFGSLGHEVYYPTAGTKIGSSGIPLKSSAESFRAVIEKAAKECAAGLLIAPDSLLSELNTLLEKYTVNLGCTPEAAACCADKLKCTALLEKAGIATPKIVTKSEPEKSYILKPRSGCGAEATYLVKDFEAKEGFIACEYLKGLHLSVSLIAGKNPLPLSVNRQFIEFTPQLSAKKGSKNNSKNYLENNVSSIKYNGSLTPFETPSREELFATALAAAKTLNCSGYVGVDIVLSERPYVVDVNPRPTASLFALSRVMKEEIGALLLQNRFGKLPASVKLEGEFRFSKDRLGEIFS
ncbi:MAG: ATP-grasp domain-containing protein [Methanosarcinaceae archaeon]|nr:ATP-grasp domain-containing protein [Methanosarcinaceae archaeon]